MQKIILILYTQYWYSTTEVMLVCIVWQYGLWSFKTRDKKERFLPKNQHTQRKSLNFEYWCQKVPKFDFKVNFLCQKVLYRIWQRIKNFCLKINIPKENYWILRIGVMGRRQRVPTFHFQYGITGYGVSRQGIQN